MDAEQRQVEESFGHEVAIAHGVERVLEATREVETYLRRMPDAPDAERVQVELKKMRLQLAMLN